MKAPRRIFRTTGKRSVVLEGGMLACMEWSELAGGLEFRDACFLLKEQLELWQQNQPLSKGRDPRTWLDLAYCLSAKWRYEDAEFQRDLPAENWVKRSRRDYNARMDIGSYNRFLELFTYHDLERLRPVLSALLVESVRDPGEAAREEADAERPSDEPRAEAESAGSTSSS